jgi:glucose-6-phosphate-specific signal transduction histidine kinase
MLQKIFNTLNRRRFLLYLLLAFLAGCLCTGLFINRHRLTSIGRLDQRYHSQHGRAAEIITRLETELERERQLTIQLREHNSRAREIAGELTNTAERNVRNLQEAVSLISEIRSKIKVLERPILHPQGVDELTKNGVAHS